ncbi:MAG: ribosomal protein S18-alanine N-acetyltransferase [Candidatus Marinimicrobia bacterium]|jgi:ribosomal-protein-alanine N-acetyltransferase|nr:ribosomal protein S18-alanine N-acetyltransferase [Candidatus Neomarinimicrobiota bacterium]
MSHLDEITAIENAVFPHPWSKTQLQHDILTQLETENFVYIQNKSVIGYIFGWVIEEEYHLNNIAVHKDFRRRQVGRSLINHVIALLIDKNVQIIFLEVDIKNTAAQKCYESLGFEQNGRRKNYYPSGDDALLYIFRMNSHG